MLTAAIETAKPTTRNTSDVVFSLVRELADAEALRPDWEQLLERATQSELTQTPDWLLTWWRVFGATQGRELRIGLFHEGDRLVGLAPLLSRRHWYRSLLPFRRLEFLASGEPVEDSICSNYSNIIAAAGCEANVAQAFVAAVNADAFGGWDEIVLPMMAGDTAMPELLVQAFQATGFHAEAEVVAAAPYIALPSRWEDYLKALSKDHRHKIKRGLAAFDKWSGGTTELECITKPADLARGMEILVQLHHHRWASDGELGVFRSPFFLGFHDRVTRILAERGGVEFLILRARGEPIAASYNLIWNKKVHAYQTGRRMDLPSHLSPCRVLDALGLQRDIGLGRREFDMLADDTRFKRTLATGVRPLVQVRAARRSVQEMIRVAGKRLLSSRRDAGGTADAEDA